MTETLKILLDSFEQGEDCLFAIIDHLLELGETEKIDKFRDFKVLQNSSLNFYYIGNGVYMLYGSWILKINTERYLRTYIMDIIDPLSNYFSKLTYFNENGTEWSCKERPHEIVKVDSYLQPF